MHASFMAWILTCYKKQIFFFFFDLFTYTYVVWFSQWSPKLLQVHTIFFFSTYNESY